MGLPRLGCHRSIIKLRAQTLRRFHTCATSHPLMRSHSDQYLISGGFLKKYWRLIGVGSSLLSHYSVTSSQCTFLPLDTKRWQEYPVKLLVCVLVLRFIKVLE